jgi:DNA helicase II / ATP-dependent DNA helicase PcrA
MEKLLNDLNPMQKDAVLHTDGPLLILAGAGSGKTRVITYRIAYLLHLGISPKNILAVTFTNKASQEMKSRLINLAGDKGSIVFVSTFHSLCARILRQEANILGLSKSFVILDDYDQKSLIKSCLKELNLDEKDFAPQTVQNLISKAKDNLIDSAEYKKSAYSSRDMIKQTVSDIYELYQKKIDDSSSLDFGDLILKTIKLYQQFPDVLKKYRELFKYILVDEYQDTNYAQYILIRLLSEEHKNICVVGDDDQSIYSWRGADIRNILEFENDYKGTKTIKLEQNYRSTKTILEAANRVINKNFGRKEKALWTENEQGYPIKILQTFDEQEEAGFVSKEIQRLITNGSSLNDIAIFYRTNAQSRVLEDVLRRNNIPYIIIGSVKFYDRKEVKDILAYLRFLINKRDTISLKRIINVPARGIGDTSIKLLESLTQEKESLYEVINRVYRDETNENLINSRLKKNIFSFISLIEELDKFREEYSAKDIAKFVIEKTLYLEFLREDKSIETESRVENVLELVSAIREYEESTGDITLEGFLEHTALVNSVDSLSGNADRITLMTLHLAKGLEFPVVFMTGMEENLFPHNSANYKTEELEEERRLCYVGMTRARKLLYMTYASQRKMYGYSRWNLPSRFIKEAELVQETKEYIPIQQEIKREEFSDQTTFNIDDKVMHKEFGLGRIIDMYGTGDSAITVVRFGAGNVKKLLLKYANLEKI